MRRLGIGYRHELAGWIATRPPEIGCLEITAEHFFDGGHDLLRSLANDYPLFVHGLGLSLGTPGPLDSRTLEQFSDVVKVADPEWISEHVAFTRTPDVDLGHLNPISPTQETLDIIAEHARQLIERFGKPLLLENITSYLQIQGEISEPEFLNRLCEAAGCSLLLDVTNLFINSKNHGFDPVRWLHEVNPQNIRQLHVVGYSFHDAIWRDYHREPIQDDLRMLLQGVIDYAPVESIIVERDDYFPKPALFAAELRQLENALERLRPDNGACTPVE